LRHRVEVHGLPPWMDAPRLLGPVEAGARDGEGWTFEETPEGILARAELPTGLAADLAARLRGLGFGGRGLRVEVSPALSRDAVRAARTEDARRRRDTSPGFTRPGTRLDEEGRWSLTPEALAERLGRQAARAFGPDAHVVDAGCGAGGNAIGFARAGLRVTALEASAERLALASHNARVYGVEGRVRFVHGDALALLPRLRGDLLFLDPPWGEAWDRLRTPASGLPLLAGALARRGGFREAWAKLPPSVALDLPDMSGSLEAWFGVAPGDRRRVKFALLRVLAGS
jgi:SAM-dependent methyltransferase